MEFQICGDAEMFAKEDSAFSPLFGLVDQSVYMNMLQARDYIARYRPCRTGFPLPGEIDRRVARDHADHPGSTNFPFFSLSPIRSQNPNAKFFIFHCI